MSYLDRRSFIMKFATAFVVTNFTRGLNLHAKEEFKTKNHQVEIKRLKFTVKELEVRIGDSVTWTNLDIAPHTATAIDKSWDTGNLKRGESMTLMITEGFSTNYYCSFHPHMKASLKIN